MLEQYFEAKKRLFPQSVKGKFRKIKNYLNIVFLSIYLFTPFLQYNRGANSPSQAVLIDITNSKAYFFFIEIWPQEVYFLTGILLMAAVILFFISSLFGRVWCGYACFQTVWTDIFIFIERLFQGDRNQRILLERKNNFEKFYKKFFTHLCWIIISLITGTAFICYFNNSYDVISSIAQLNVSLAKLGWICGIAFMTYLMAGFAREHVCTFMCPYSRFQSAMFDKNTLIISYDNKRGEPRQKAPKDNDFSNRGHCIDCKQCVVVCPVGIDIRNGLQMECIACGLCIDACNSVMEKFNLEKGLIRYDTLAHLENPIAKNKFKILKPRTIFYSTIITIASILMLKALIFKTPLEINIIADRNPLFVTMSDGSIRNGYTLRIVNKSNQNKYFKLQIADILQADIKVQNYDVSNLEILSREVATFKIYVKLSPKFLEKITEDRLLIDLDLIDKKTNAVEKISAIFIKD
jgi:cytochrome c oxidase accessory protein FixG